jgi:hypothetical protein
MKILSFNPVVWAFMFFLTFIAYFARINPTLDFPFKLAYNIAAYGLTYGLLVFENWRIENSRVDWKALCKEKELSKK